MWSIIEWKLVRSEVVFTLLWQSVLNNLPANNFSKWAIMGNYFQHLYKWVVRTREAEVLPPSYTDLTTLPSPGLPPSYSQCLVLQEAPPRYTEVRQFKQAFKKSKKPGVFTYTSTWTTHTQIVNEESMGQWACQFKVLNYSAIFITFTPRSTEIRQLS